MKKKKLLALMLSAAMTVTTVAPVGAAEFTDEPVVFDDGSNIVDVAAATQITVVYDGNGGAWGGLKTFPITYKPGTKLSDMYVAEPRRAGYTFTGWADVEGNVIDMTTTDATATTYYAQWKQNDFEVVYDGNGGAWGGLKTFPITYKPGTKLSDMYVAEPRRAGYTFTGWADAKGNVIDMTTTDATATTYYAQWKQNDFEVVYDGNGGAWGGLKTFPITYKPGTKLSDMYVAEPRRAGYTFTGWADAEGNVIDMTTTDATATTYYAQWKQNDFEVVYDGNGGAWGGLKTFPITYKPGTKLSDMYVAEPRRAGYTFTGWADAEGNVIDMTTTDATATTYYAQWKQNDFEVVYDGNGGAWGGLKTFPITYKPGTKLSDMYVAEPRRAGYTFTGWADAKGNVIDMTTTDATATTYYAQWKQNNFIITFDGNTGDWAGIKNYTYEYTPDAVILDTWFIAVPRKKGYTFTGWNTKADGTGEELTATTKATASVTYYAQWEENKVAKTINVTFTNPKDVKDGKAWTVTIPLTKDGQNEFTVPAAKEIEGFTFINWKGEKINLREGKVTFDYLNDNFIKDNFDKDGKAYMSFVANYKENEKPAVKTIDVTFTNPKDVKDGKEWTVTVPLTKDGQNELTVPTAKEIEGFTFINWKGEKFNLREGKVTFDYLNDNFIKDNFDKDGKAYMSFVANYKENEKPAVKTIDVTFTNPKDVKDGKEWTVTVPLTKDGQNELTVPAAKEIEGFTFVNWKGEKINLREGKVTFDYLNDNFIKDNFDKDGKAYMSFVANYKENEKPAVKTIDVTFTNPKDVKDGKEWTVTVPLTKDGQNELTVPAAKEIEGFTFINWKGEKINLREGKVTFDYLNDNFIKDNFDKDGKAYMSFVANYKENEKPAVKKQIIVTFKNDSRYGTAKMANWVVTEGSNTKYPTPKVTAKDGYKFLRWNNKEHNVNVADNTFVTYNWLLQFVKDDFNKDGKAYITFDSQYQKVAVKKQIIVTFTSDYGYVDKAKKNKTVKYVLNETTNSSVKCPYVYSKRGNKYTNVGWGFEGTDRNHTIYAGRTLRFDALSGCVSFDKNGKAYVTIDDKKVKR